MKETTANFIRQRIASPRKFARGSLRIVDPGRPGHTKLIVGCPRGFFRRGRCRTGTALQAILTEKKQRRKRRR